MFFVAILIINLLTVIPLTSLFRFKSLTKYLVGYFVLFCSLIIVIGNFLGLISRLNDAIAWLILHVVFLVFSWSLWVILRKPQLFPFSSPLPSLRKLSIFEKFLLILLSLALVICYLVLLYLIFTVPPNNNDSMLVHLARVGYWMQQGSFAPWNAINERQIVYPYAAQIILLWLTLFLKSDLLTPLLQFICVLLTSVSIYGISRTLGAGRFVSLMLGGIYLTFPQVILQATSTQNDLAITFFISAGTLFLLGWIKDHDHKFSYLILSALSYAISLGIKAVSYYYLGGLAVALLILLLIKILTLKNIARFIITLASAFFLLSSLAYINNTIHFGTPFGSQKFLRTESGLNDQGNLLEKIRVNGFRLIYQFTSLDGYPYSMQSRFEALKKGFAERHPDLFDTSLEYIKDPGGELFTLDGYIANNEDLSWFGPILPLLLLPTILFALVRTIRKKDALLIILLSTGLISFLLVTVLRPGWDPYQGRYINPSVALLFPITALMLDRRILDKIMISILIPFALVPLFFSTFVNDSKPIFTHSLLNTDCERNFINKLQCDIVGVLSRNVLIENFPNKAAITRLDSRVAKQTYTNPSQYSIFNYIENLPEGSRIAIVLGDGDWEYPYFGDHFQFEVIPIPDIQKVTLQDLQQMNADYIVVHNRNLDYSVIKQMYSFKIVISEGGDYPNWIVFSRLP